MRYYYYSGDFVDSKIRIGENLYSVGDKVNIEDTDKLTLRQAWEKIDDDIIQGFDTAAVSISNDIIVSGDVTWDDEENGYEKWFIERIASALRYLNDNYFIDEFINAAKKQKLADWQNMLLLFSQFELEANKSYEMRIRYSQEIWACTPTGIVMSIGKSIIQVGDTIKKAIK